jgi:hypothetical protein
MMVVSVMAIAFLLMGVSAHCLLKQQFGSACDGGHKF